MKAFNEEYNNKTNNSTQLPSDMTQDKFKVRDAMDGNNR